MRRLVVIGLVAAAVLAGFAPAIATELVDELPVDLVCPSGSTLDPFGAGQCVDDATGAVVGTWGTDGTYTPEPDDDVDDVEVLGSEVYRPTPADRNDLPIEPVLVEPAFTG